MQTLDDIKVSHAATRLWTEGRAGSEYFLVETRFRSSYDLHLPAEGLLLWHVDESRGDNNNEHHPKVAPVQTDGRRDLEAKRNSGDPQDTFPGRLGIATCDKSTNPSTKGYSGADTKVSLTKIASSGTRITMEVKVRS